MTEGIRLRGGPAANTATPWLRRVYEWMVEDGFVPGRKWCLDLGAGNGRNAHWLAQQGMHTYAFDPQPASTYVRPWNGRGWPKGTHPHSFDIILLQYVLMFVTPANLKAMAAIVNAAARYNCVLVLEAYKAKSGAHYRRMMLQAFVRRLNDRLKKSQYPGRWEFRMADGEDHVAYQLRPIKEEE